MFKDLIILVLVGYIIYKIFSRFVLPIVRLTNTANDHMRRMQDQMQAQMREMEQKTNQQNTQQKARVKNDGDYIDYEELK